MEFIKNIEFLVHPELAKKMENDKKYCTVHYAFFKASAPQPAPIVSLI